MSTSTTKPSLPDDDDLDELDDVLSQFTSPSPSLSSPPPPPSASTATTFGRPRHNTAVPIPGFTKLDTTHEEEESAFARELAKEMENLMRELSADPGPEGSTKTTGFQDKIKQAVNKLQESESNLQTDGPKSPNDSTTAPNAESLEAFLGSLGDLSLGEGGDDKELAGLLENMMGELMGKSILYGPLSELAQGFPPYLANPPSPLSDEDRKRYSLQLDCVRRILAVFDQAGYDDKKTECHQQIADLMTEMQNYGSPPSELMGPLPSDEEGCRIV